METPKSLRQRPARSPTPRLSERKKSLFTSRSRTPEINSDSEQENHKEPASEKNDKTKRVRGRPRSVQVLVPRTPTRPISFLKNNNNSSPERMDDDEFVKLPESPPSNATPLRRSGRLSVIPKIVSPPAVKLIPSISSARDTHGKENMPDELPALFTNSMNLNKSKKLAEDEVVEESSDDESVAVIRKVGKKRNHLPTSDTESKIRRLDNCERLPISTKSFYSHTKTSPTARSPPSAVVVKRSPKSRRSVDIKPRALMQINKGVRHKIRKKPKVKISTTTSTNVVDILSKIRNERLRNLLIGKRLEKDQIENVHQIFKSAKNPIEMAKPLSVISRKTSVDSPPNDGNNNKNNNNNNKSLSSGRCYSNSVNDIPLGFSDLECSSESEAELPEELHTIAEPLEADEEPENRTPTPIAGRKFFKFGSSTTKKEVKITDNIRASVCNGKLSIMQNPKQKRKKIKIRNTHVNEFSVEQARVDEILKNFDISAVAQEEEVDVDQPTIVPEDNQPAALTCVTPTTSNDDFDTIEEMRMTETEDDEEFHEFRARLPYNTSDPELIEQQHTLLDFLITNKICTEENFKVFISDPDNHKEEAQRIVDQLVVVVSETPEVFRQRIPYNTTDPVEIDQQKNFLTFLIENNICNEENFQIFIADYANRHEEADRIITAVVAKTHNISAEDLERELNRFNSQPVAESMQLDQKFKLEKEDDKLFPIFYSGGCPPIIQPKSTRKYYKTWNAGHGLNQYQIDAGQKQFGPRQCKQCGLVYTVHEPEEEKLHKDYHASLHVLKFKSWIDEDIVQIYLEWGNDGRVIRITDNSHAKRQERLKDVLQLVDKELGFASYVLPKHFVAYFAVRQSQIVGVCLVEPLTKAHRYVLLNGVDCCTEETFDAKCGISRIWVSPLHRRFHIASKLIRSVQLYTIFGEEIPLDKIAFSAPTEDGKRFAKSVTKSENFLIYQ